MDTVIDYGISVGDKVEHIKSDDMTGIITQIDSDYDLGGVTTCTVAWEAQTLEEALLYAKEDLDIQWTNKLVRV